MRYGGRHCGCCRCHGGMAGGAGRGATQSPQLSSSSSGSSTRDGAGGADGAGGSGSCSLHTPVLGSTGTDGGPPGGGVIGVGMPEALPLRSRHACDAGFPGRGLAGGLHPGGMKAGSPGGRSGKPGGRPGTRPPKSGRGGGSMITVTGGFSVAVPDVGDPVEVVPGSGVAACRRAAAGAFLAGTSFPFALSGDPFGEPIAALQPGPGDSLRAHG